MNTTPTESHYWPLAQWKDLGHLDVRELWTELDGSVQLQLESLANDVRRIAVGVRASRGRTSTERFLFSYCTFSMPDCDIDPVVAGLTFSLTPDGIKVEADVSGEESGDFILAPSVRRPGDSREELLASARELAKGLYEAAEAIAAALKNPNRSCS